MVVGGERLNPLLTSTWFCVPRGRQRAVFCFVQPVGSEVIAGRKRIQATRDWERQQFTRIIRRQETVEETRCHVTKVKQRV
jgi:hypothetical protein